ncbi:hypothetical protein KSP40_PGU010943 [Platanthera guangdongensis]|uniref:Uncharacterized protein n=1 Tax=Platanthera guangdongensis TaxID=2320717 RepID=A0ABR2MT79_9ASPA
MENRDKRREEHVVKKLETTCTVLQLRDSFPLPRSRPPSSSFDLAEKESAMSFPPATHPPPSIPATTMRMLFRATKHPIQSISSSTTNTPPVLTRSTTIHVPSLSQPATIHMPPLSEHVTNTHSLPKEIFTGPPYSASNSTSSASSAMLELLKSAKLAMGMGQAPGRDESYVKQLPDYINLALLEAIHKVILLPLLHEHTFYFHTSRLTIQTTISSTPIHIFEDTPSPPPQSPLPSHISSQIDDTPSTSLHRDPLLSSLNFDPLLLSPQHTPQNSAVQEFITDELPSVIPPSSIRQTFTICPTCSMPSSSTANQPSKSAIFKSQIDFQGVLLPPPFNAPQIDSMQGEGY